MCFGNSADAQSLNEDQFARLAGAQILLLGEAHDNPAHHRVQVEIVTRLAPNAVVYEMLTADQAEAIVPSLLQNEADLEAALGWEGSGWPDFSFYYPIFRAAPEAMVFGAEVPRDVAKTSMEQGLVAAFGPEAALYGLTESLPENEQAAREALQMSAHCNALPEELLPAMVDTQRLRDARLAQVALDALETSGGPVVVIAGNGHARADWGVPAIIARVRPEVRVMTVGQGEAGTAPSGVFDIVTDALTVEREDPCAVFAK